MNQFITHNLLKAQRKVKKKNTMSVYKVVFVSVKYTQKTYLQTRFNGHIVMPCFDMTDIFLTLIYFFTTNNNGEQDTVHI